MAKKILIIDDDSELCEEIEEVLKDEGYFVRSVQDGDNWGKIAKADSYDIILLDFKVPGLNCAEVLRSLKKNNPSAKVFLMSGKPFIEKFLEENKLSDLIAGSIIKPFGADKLLEKIKNIE